MKNTFDSFEVTSDSWSHYKMIVSPFLSIVSDDLVLFRDDLLDCILREINRFSEDLWHRTVGIFNIRNTSSNHCPSWLVIVDLGRFKDSDGMLQYIRSSRELSCEIQTSWSSSDHTNRCVRSCCEVVPECSVDHGF